MLNPLITAISGQVRHPYAGAKKSKGITKRHRPLFWECMLGTVYALDPLDKDINRTEKYFDYDYTAAHLHAKVAQCTDLRTYRRPRGKLVMYGIPPAQT